MSDTRCEKPFASSGYICDCYKKLEQYGIPLYIRDENEYYSEEHIPIAFETAFRPPGILEINDDITEYLKVEDNNLPTVFQHMAEVFPSLRDYEDNVLSFWVLDVLTEGLCTAQNAKMCFEHQKATLQWIAYMLNYIQKENPTRKQLFNQLKVILFQKHRSDEDYEFAGESGNESIISLPIFQCPLGVSLPQPPILYKPGMETEKRQSSAVVSTSEEFESEEGREELTTILSEKGESSEEKEATQIADMKVIAEILYRIFARVSLYLHIQTVLNKMPSLEKVDLPFLLQTPKPLSKMETTPQPKTDKAGKKSSICEKPCDTVPSDSQLHKNDYILPLQAAEEAKEYLRRGSEPSIYWRSKEEKNKK